MIEAHRRILSSLAIGAAVWSAGCSNTVTHHQSPSGGEAGTGGVAGSGGAGASGGTEPPEPAILTLAAPDEYTVKIGFNVDPAAPSIAYPASYSISSEVGPLDLEQAEYDPATRTVTLTSARQKLGIEYALSIEAPGEPIDGLGGDFLSADTALF